MILVGVGGGLLALLAVAAMLQPSPLGYGTHQQLGLPPCSFSEIFGIRCPSCGMTTSWAYFVRGQLLPSLRANSGGTLLGMLAALMGPWFLVSGVQGRWSIGRPDERIAIVLAVSIVLVTIVDWCLRLAA
jgi:hypothetical protein